MTHQKELDLGDASPLMQQPDMADNTLHIARQLVHHRDRIKSALVYCDGTHTFDDVVSKIMHGQYIFWSTENSVLVMEVIQYPQCKHLNVMLGAGNLDEISTLMSDLVRISKGAGCAAITMTGRKGWCKLLVDELGWKECSTTFSYKIGGDHG